jgi:Undecaprenyl-phosphate glucose phosphotransferase
MARRHVAAGPRATAAIFAQPERRVVGFRVPLQMLVDVIMLAEAMLVVAAAALAKAGYIAFVLDSQQSLEPYVVAGIAGALLMHSAMRMRGLYDPKAILGWRKHLGDMLLCIGLTFLSLIAIAYLFKLSSDYSRGWLLVWLALVTILLPASRLVSARVLRWLTAIGATMRRVAIIGDHATAAKLADRLAKSPEIAVHCIFPVLAGNDADLSSTVRDVVSMGQRNEFDELIIAISREPGFRVANLVDGLRVLPVDISMFHTELDIPVYDVAKVEGVSLFRIRLKPIRNWEFAAKLALDYAICTVCLILLAPVMAVVSLAIYIDNPGPVFFRQRRHGYNHRVIDVYKFRTMTVMENGDRIHQATRNDPRVTRVGKFLRKTSLDELPQLFNVLKGEMSLVGPRPHALAHNQEYTERLARYENRHCVKPGMTGLAQINGLRGPTDNPEKMRKRVELDLHYIENWSFWLDLKILLLTPFMMHRNAL